MKVLCLLVLAVMVMAERPYYSWSQTSPSGAKVREEVSEHVDAASIAEEMRSVFD